MNTKTINFQVEKTADSKVNAVDWDNLPFGKVFSDHMLEMDYVDGKWQDPVIRPFQDLKMHPATSVIHYGQSIFEGLKAYRKEDGSVSIFRPDMNGKRFAESCERMCMPELSPEMFVELVAKLVEIDEAWVPKKEGYSLYIRPFLFAMDNYIGIKPSDTYKFMIFTCPVGAYYAQPLNVKIEEKYTRAAEGGVGRAKTAGNYAASLYPAMLGQQEGYHQLVWTDAKEHKYIEESGTMNIMFVIDDVLITPSEDSDTILRGITKRSVVEVAQQWGMKVEERKVTVEEIITACREGRVQEAFGAGTAATIAPIKMIGFRDEKFELPAVETREFSNKVHKYLDNLKVGKIADENNWVFNV
ncbi:branched-chain amino acid aminotransferase [Lishizhenia sp.]|uniref:branched-chain amino acid aminotransferase n=1 Tax=Lishizhenia sp. TaxID=2497594 RepID=UPI00299E9F63|nr:branched-chain amino acid aminotransferase [Lishizhenia sp.]MDX1446431.1 branched-chain amino acid aminotransferase [Lishizhenia sp.]